MKNMSHYKIRNLGIFALLTIVILCSIAGSTLIPHFSPQLQAQTNDLLQTTATTPVLSWNVTWGDSYSQFGEDVAIDASGNIYCVGQTLSFDPLGDLGLTKFFPNKTKAWEVSWGGNDIDRGISLAIDTSGNIYCIGLTRSFGALGSNLALVKFFPNSTKAWDITWGGNDEDEGQGIAIDASGNIYCIGDTLSYGAGSSDLALIKYFPNKTKAWDVTWGSYKVEFGFGVAIDPLDNSSIYCLGSTNSFGAGDSDFALVKFFSNKTRAWNVTWGGVSYEFGYNMAFDTSGNIYCVGGTNSFGMGGTDLALVKFFPNSTKAWNVTWGGYLSDEGLDIAIDAGGNIYCVGDTSSFAVGGSDLALVKFFPNNNRAWNITWGGIAADGGAGIVLNTSKNIYCVGYTRSFADSDGDWLLIKYEIPSGNGGKPGVPGFGLLWALFPLLAFVAIILWRKSYKNVQDL